MSPSEQVFWLRDSAAVRRNHTARVRQQTVGEHCHGVLEIILAIRPNPSAELLIAAIRHDVYEVVTGDAPAPAKWAFDELNRAHELMELRMEASMGFRRAEHNLSSGDTALLKWADAAEYAYFCIEELRMGNRFAWAGLERIIGALSKRQSSLEQDDLKAAADIMNYIRAERNNHERE